MTTNFTQGIKFVRSKTTGLWLLMMLMLTGFNSYSQCGSAPTYCTPTVTNVANYGIGIANVTLGSTINNTTTATGAGPNYFDFSNQIVFSSAGSTVNFSVTNGPSNTTMIKIFIDYNLDGTFNTTSPELVWTSGNTSPSAAVSGSFVVPTGQALGLYKVRVTGDYGGYYTGLPCNNNYGEIEDYTMIITSSVPNVSAIAISPSGFAVGSNTIAVTYQNQGSTTISSLSFGYLSSSNNTVVSGSVSGLTLTAGSTGTYTFGTPLTLAAGSYTLKVWANNPNGVNPDANVCGDTITVTACTGIAGSFTINPGGSGSSNYLSFTSAVTALNNCGVSGPVVFTVSPGTYSEKLTLNNISGVSATNTIVFDGVDSSTRKITYNETGTPSNPAVINFMGAKYVTFKNLGITALGSSTSIGVLMMNGSNYDQVLKCNITVSPSSTSSSCFGFGVCGSTYSSSSTGSNNYFEDCKVTGGYVGASLYTASANGASNNVIRGNKFINLYYSGIWTNYQTNDSIMDNNIQFRSNQAYGYGIYNYYNLNYHIERNTIQNFFYMGIYSYAYNINSTNATLYNNIFNGSIANAYSYQYGMYMYYTNGVNIYHNTMYTVGSNAYGAYIAYGTNMNVKNNIFHSIGSAAYCIYVPSTGGFNSFDYNILYSASANTFAYFGGNYIDFASLKAAGGSFHQKSLSKIANFVSLTTFAEDLHLTASAPAETGDTLKLALDVDKDARCPYAPSIGADESKYTTGPPVAGFTAPDSVFINSPVVFFNNAPSNAPLGHKWFLDGNLVSSSINYSKIFNSTGTYTIKLITFGCSGIDSITKVIKVYNPTQKPISDFISDLNVVETYQQVRFTDLSVKGPTYWYWTFVPSVGVNYNNGTTNLSQNPVVSFTNPGLYQVCLWDSNSIGRSVTVCKTAYILVRATNQMCIFPFETKVASGTLYDDGGPNGNYSTGGTCNFLIDPCASSVTLKFTQFVLSANSYLRIYNGKDNLSPALHTGLGFNGTAIPGGLTGITASSGKMYIEFVKGAAAAGFAASWTSVASAAPIPTGTLIDPDTAYDCGASSTFTYSPTSLSFPKDGAYYTWYFDYLNSPFPDAEGRGLYTFDWSYGSTGSYVVRLDIEGCGGIQTIYDTIVISHPLTGPIVDFKADLLTATKNDIVYLTDLSKLDPIWWKWTITGPGAVTAASGNSNSKIYGVKFTTPGLYSVTLKDSNCVGSNTLTKTNYITVIDYCDPRVTSLNADFAIERFKFGRADTIINNTVYGLDYTNTTPAVGTVTYRDNTNKFTNYTINNVTIANKAVEAVVGLGESFNFDVKRLSNFNAVNFKIWIDYNQDGTFNPTTELVASSGSTSGINFTGSITIPQSAKLGYTRLRIGTNFGTSSNTPCGINDFGDFNDFRIKITPDITAPVITITGNVDTIFVEVGRAFNDPGTTVTGATTVTHSGMAYGTIVSTFPSLSLHTITASDAAGNTAIRNIYIRATKDVTKPVITKNGADTVYSEVGSVYTDLGAIATDFYYGSVTGSIVSTSTVNINKIGAYTVTYNVMDAAGNAADAVKRVVIIRDTQIPVITINGANPLYVSVFSTFNPPTATVTDNYNSGLTYTITGGPVNTSLIGTYTLFYNAKDSSNNVAATKTLTVIVRDITPPQLTLIPQDTMIIDCITLTTVPEPGYVVSDNYYAATQITVAKVGTVNLNVLGTYVIRYYATDPSGNVDSSKVRVYKIIDREAPVITLKGLDIMNWPRWKTFVDPGYTLYDKCDPTAIVTADYSKLNILMDGLYEINYSSTDASGNKAANMKRYVNIYTAISGINNNGGNNLFNVYPNPNNGLVNVDLNIENSSAANIIIFDANGKVVYSNSNINAVNNKIQIDLSAQAAGMYFIKVVTDNFSASRSFSISK